MIYRVKFRKTFRDALRMLMQVSVLDNN